MWQGSKVIGSLLTVPGNTSYVVLGAVLEVQGRWSRVRSARTGKSLLSSVSMVL